MSKGRFRTSVRTPRVSRAVAGALSLGLAAAALSACDADESCPRRRLVRRVDRRRRRPTSPRSSVKTNLANAQAVPVDTAVAVNASNGTLSKVDGVLRRRARSPAR